MFSHPETDMAESFQDSRHRDCANCHRVGFEEPLVPDPYGYVAYPFQGFYDPCPWWVDCGSSTILGGAEGGTGVETSKRRTRVERFLGVRGGSRPQETVTPSAPAATPAGTSVSGDSGSSDTSPAGKSEPTGQQSGRTMKKGSSSKGSKDPKPDARGDQKPQPNGGGR